MIVGEEVITDCVLVGGWWGVVEEDGEEKEENNEDTNSSRQRTTSEGSTQPTHTNKHTEFEDHQCRGRERERGIILEAKKWVPGNKKIVSRRHPKWRNE